MSAPSPRHWVRAPRNPAARGAAARPAPAAPVRARDRHHSSRRARRGRRALSAAPGRFRQIHSPPAEWRAQGPQRATLCAKTKAHSSRALAHAGSRGRIAPTTCSPSMRCGRNRSSQDSACGVDPLHQRTKRRWRPSRRRQSQGIAGMQRFPSAARYDRVGDWHHKCFRTWAPPRRSLPERIAAAA